MREIEVQSSSHRYKIVIGENVRWKIKHYLPKEYSSVFIITDENVAPLYLEDVKNGLAHNQLYEAIIPSGEQTKSFDYYYELQTKAIAYGLDRNSLIIALGGGVIGDLAGFVAATLFRGVDYIQVPTTILAHDSSVGGKVAINHEQGKNLIGNFYSPQAVIYDVETLGSLSVHEVRSGYAELVKEALIANEAFYKELLTTDLSNLSTHQLLEHLQEGIRIKAHIVERDERESGERMFLNLGHTLGHALEAELGYGKITHGEAVSIGLLFALMISEKLFNVQLPYLSLKDWMQRNHYPVHLPSLSTESILGKMKHDKKTVQNRIQMVLLKEIGAPVVQTVSDAELFRFLDKFFGELINP